MEKPSRNVTVICRDCGQTFVTAKDSIGQCFNCGGAPIPSLVTTPEEGDTEEHDDE